MTGHIINGHYMYGNTFIQPDLPIYNKIPHHIMAPVSRPIPPYPDMINRPINCPGGKPGCNLSYEDTANKIDTPYEDSSYSGDDCNCDECPFSSNGIIRDPLMFNVFELETSIIKTLRVKIYGTSAEQDKTIEMETGKRYAVTYITEHGLITSVGRLELISDSVPDSCTRYIKTNNMAATSTAYIGMDCSTEGNSDKRKIYITSIRFIQKLEDGEEAETEEVKTLKTRLQELLDAIEAGELVFCNKDCYDNTDENSAE
jgi:hypothetical protein